MVIGWISGTLKHKSWPHVIVETGGVGYEMQVPLRTFEELGSEGQQVELHVLTLFRQESLQLFGFSSNDEKTMFKTFLSVSGVGPRLGLALLSGVSPSQLVSAVRDEKTQALEAVPGIGKKTAKRLLLELKDKVESFELEGFVAVGPGRMPADPLEDDAVSALENLGFRRADAETAVGWAREQVPDAPLADVVRTSLRRLSKH